MWEFSKSNLDTTTLWPPDAAQEQTSVVYPSSTIPYRCPFTGVLFPRSETQGRPLQFCSTFFPHLNTPAPSPANYSELEAITTKRFLVFEPSLNQTSFTLSSSANPALPARNAISVYPPNGHIISEEEMHEDTEEIDALLYSESEYIEEESSTGHSPLDVEGEEIASSDHPAKRRRLVSAETESLLMDTACSAMLPSIQCLPEDDRIDLSFISCMEKGGENPGRRSRNLRNKREKIQATVSALRKIIPGGKGQDTASVLDEAIQYLKSLKLRASAVGATSSAL